MTEFNSIYEWACMARKLLDKYARTDIDVRSFLAAHITRQDETLDASYVEEYNHVMDVYFYGSPVVYEQTLTEPRSVTNINFPFGWKPAPARFNTDVSYEYIVRDSQSGEDIWLCKEGLYLEESDAQEDAFLAMSDYLYDQYRETQGK